MATGMAGRAALHPTAGPNRVDRVVPSPTEAYHKPPYRRTGFHSAPFSRIKGAINVLPVPMVRGPLGDIRAETKQAIRRFKSAPTDSVTTSVRVITTGPGQVPTPPRARSGSMATTS